MNIQSPFTWPQTLVTLIAGQNLSQPHTAWAMSDIMAGSVSAPTIAGFLVGLRAKGETIDELAGLSEAMLAHAEPCPAPRSSVDIVGTGGDGARTVNISTMAALVVAGAGVPVVKHGNRAASSASGAADVLEELGILLDRSPARVAELVAEIGITFCFAQVFHPAMRHAAVARKELGIPTAFNFLGPLTNPAQPRAAAIGVADPRMAPLIAGVFATRESSVLVFRGDDGLDELAATGMSTVWEVREGHIRTHRVDPSRDLDLPRISVEQLRGGDARHNAAVARRLLEGEPGPVRDTVLLNAAAALVADGRLEGTQQGSLINRFQAAYRWAAQSVDQGSARDVLDRWIAAD